MIVDETGNVPENPLGLTEHEIDQLEDIDFLGGLLGGEFIDGLTAGAGLQPIDLERMGINIDEVFGPRPEYEDWTKIQKEEKRPVERTVD